MDFLVNAIVAEEDSRILGLRLTHFDPDDYTGRASVKLFNVADFSTLYSELKPSGFQLTEQGALMSDTQIRRAVANSVFDYMQRECAAVVEPTLDVTDLVLLGAAEEGYVFVNYEELRDKGTRLQDELENVIMIPFKNFKVSASSFNIYAGYVRPDKTYRTFSLLQLEDGSAYSYYVSFPATADLSKFGEAASIVDEYTSDEGQMIVYKVTLGLSTFYASVGESFLHYLAYNVSFYNIGEKVLKELLPAMPTLPCTVEEVDAKRPPRKAKVNVAIECGCKESKLQDIVNLLPEPDLLKRLLEESPEAAISYQWVSKAYNSPWFNDAEGELDDNGRLYVSCTNMLRTCRITRLKFALELLRHRYYIYSMGLVNDTLGAVLRGGGVHGCSIKRSDFGYR